MAFQSAQFQEKYGCTFRFVDSQQPFDEVVRGVTNWQQYVVIRSGTHFLYARLSDLRDEIQALNLPPPIPVVYLTLKKIQKVWRGDQVANRPLSNWLANHVSEPTLVIDNDEHYLFLNPAAGAEEKGAIPQPVFFSAVYPPVLTPEVKETFYVYAHLAKHANILRDLSQKFGVERAEDWASIAYDTPLRITPCYRPIMAPGEALTDEHLMTRQGEVTFDPPYHDMVWTGNCEKVAFEVLCTEAVSGSQVEVIIKITGDGVIPVGSIDFTFMTHALGLPPPNHISRKTQCGARTFYDVFISYAREDTELIRRVVDARRNLRDTVFWDQDSIRAGENWRATLAEGIDRSDVFALYWSTNAYESKHVREEYEYVLKHHQSAVLYNRFLRPYFWEDSLPPLPLDLQTVRSQFERIDFAKLIPH